MKHESWLFVPATPKYLSGKHLSEPDVLVIDLEDSLRPEQKDAALEETAAFLGRRNEPGQKVYVRLDGSLAYREAAALEEYAFEGYMLPKTEGTKQMDMLEPVLCGRKLIALIESPAGIVNIEKIAGDPRVSALAFGAEDYCRALSVETNETASFFARSVIVLYAHMHQKPCLDTVCFETTDMELFARQYELSEKMGFSGKLLIHPAQVEYVNMKKREADRADIRHILDTYAAAESGVLNIGGKWYERPHIERLKEELTVLENDDDADRKNRR